MPNAIKMIYSSFTENSSIDLLVTSLDKDEVFIEKQIIDPARTGFSYGLISAVVYRLERIFPYLHNGPFMAWTGWSQLAVMQTAMDGLEGLTVRAIPFEDIYQQRERDLASAGKHARGDLPPRRKPPRADPRKIPGCSEHQRAVRRGRAVEGTPGARVQKVLRHRTGRLPPAPPPHGRGEVFAAIESEHSRYRAENRPRGRRAIHAILHRSERKIAARFPEPLTSGDSLHPPNPNDHGISRAKIFFCVKKIALRSAISLRAFTHTLIARRGQAV